MVEHPERHANAVTLRRDTDAVLLEMAEPFGGRQRDDVDVRRAMLPRAGADETNAQRIEPGDEMIAEVETMVLDILDAQRFDHVERGTERMDRRKIEIAELETARARGEIEPV